MQICLIVSIFAKIVMVALIQIDLLFNLPAIERVKHIYLVIRYNQLATTGIITKRTGLELKLK